MAFVATDWSFNRTTRDLRYIGDDHGGASPSYSTVIEIHRALQDFADDLVSFGDDELDITDPNPSSRSTDNIIQLLGGCNIDDGSSEHIYDGSIIQNGGDDIYDGIVNFGPAGTNVQILQNGGILADDWWNSNGGLNPDSAQGISHRFMIKVRSGGVDIDGRRLLGTSRQFGFSYEEFPINGTSRGNNVLALSPSTDLNNQTLEATIATYTNIINLTEGYIGLDISGDGTDEFYYSEWDLGTRTVNDLYERAKWLTREGSTETLYGLNGEVFRGITHEISIDTPTGTFNAFEPVSWAGGTGQMLAIDSPTAGTVMYIQLLTGSAPVDNDTITGGTSGATADVNVTIVERSTSDPFVGASTGSALIGAYGIGLQVDDVTAADTFFDLDNTPITPPNNVTFSVNGLIIGEDTVQVAPWDGASLDVNGNPDIDRDQLSLLGALTTDDITSVQVSTTIPSDTPSTGYIRVVDDNGFARRLSYSSWTGDTFTIDSTDGQEDFLAVNASATNNVWISYIDLVAASTTETFTVVYNGDRQLVVIVRDGGGTPIKEFISSAVLGSSGGSITVIRTTDL